MTSISTISVPFHGDNLYVVNYNGQPYVPMKPIIEGMGMDWASQFTKLKKRFAKGIAEITIPSKGGEQSMLCLALRKLAGWLHTISPNKVKPEIRDKVIRYQEECDDVLYEYWTTGEVKPKQSTTTDDRAPLRNAVDCLMTKKRLPFPKAYKYVHAKYGVNSIDEVPLDLLPEAVDYIYSVALEGEYIPKQGILPINNPQLTDNELEDLCWLWKFSTAMIAAMKDVEPILRAAEHRLASKYAGLPKESAITVESTRKILERLTVHVKVSGYTDDNWRVLNQIRQLDILH